MGTVWEQVCHEVPEAESKDDVLGGNANREVKGGTSAAEEEVGNDKEEDKEEETVDDVVGVCGFLVT